MTSVELETITIGSIVAYSSNLSVAMPILKREYFEEESYKIIYDNVISLYSKGVEIDSVTLAKELKRNGKLDQVGGMYSIYGIQEKTTFSTNIEVYCRLLAENYMKRETQRIGQNITNKAIDPTTDPFDIISEAESDLNKILNGLVIKQANQIDYLAANVINNCKDVIQNGIKPGIFTSINALNRQTNGWQNGDLIILAGRPGMGKTSAAIDFVLNPALNGTATAFFSLEMSEEQLASRVLSVISSINVQNIVNKNLSKDELDHIMRQTGVLHDIPLFIDDTPALTLFELRNKAKKLKKDKNIELIVIDYLQLMRGINQKDNREQEISTISRGLKALAKELKIPIIALSQLSRECEKRPDKKPMLSDLRDSGAIEQDADMVIFLLRPEYYGLQSYFYGTQEISSYQLFLFIIAKFRNGQTGEIRAKWIGEKTAIENYETL